MNEEQFKWEESLKDNRLKEQKQNRDYNEEMEKNAMIVEVTLIHMTIALDVIINNLTNKQYNYGNKRH